MRQTGADTDSEHQGIDKTYRESVDMGVAIASQMKRAAFDASVAAPQVEAPAPVEQPAPPRRSFKGRVFRLSKRVIRRVVLPLYLGAKPVVRPVTSRIRRNLLESFQLETRAAHEETRYLLWAIRAQAEQIAASQQALQQQSLALEQQTKALQQQSQTAHQILQNILSDVGEFAPQLDCIEEHSATAARHVAINCGPNEVIVRTHVGYVVCAATDHAVLVALMESGDLERGTRLLIQTILEPGDVFLDVGAHIGLHTLAAARAMQGIGQIVAFEPYETSINLLRESVLMNGFAPIVTTHHAAVSDYIGYHPLHLGMISGHHSLYPLSSGAKTSGLEPKAADSDGSVGSAVTTDAQAVTVNTRVVTLDSAIPPDMAPDLIKIDVEGAELEVLRGAKSVIERNPNVALIVEFGPSHLARTGHSATDWLAAFETLGLIFKVIEPETGVLEQWSVERLEQVDSVNLFFARPDAAVWQKVNAQ